MNTFLPYLSISLYLDILDTKNVSFFFFFFFCGGGGGWLGGLEDGGNDLKFEVDGNIEGGDWH